MGAVLRGPIVGLWAWLFPFWIARPGNVVVFPANRRTSPTSIRCLTRSSTGKPPASRCLPLMSTISHLLSRKPMSHAGLFSSLGFCVALFGCASTTVEISGATPTEPLCQSSGEKLSALVLWGPIWRADQKDVPLREEAAQHGLEDFFAHSGCFTKVDIRRLLGGGSSIVPSDHELLLLASTVSPTPDRLLVVTVRELGPVVKLLSSPALLEGGTDVVLELKVLDIRTGASLANFRTHWQNGGPLVIKGVKTLPQDMSSALQAALTSTAPSR
jgi:hypothetical protein